MNDVSMTIIVAPNRREGMAYAKTHGYTRSTCRIVTPHGNSYDGRALTSPNLEVIPGTKLPPEKARSIMHCFAHATPDIRETTRQKLHGTQEAHHAIKNFLNL